MRLNLLLERLHHRRRRRMLGLGAAPPFSTVIWSPLSLSLNLCVCSFGNPNSERMDSCEGEGFRRLVWIWPDLDVCEENGRKP